VNSGAKPEIWRLTVQDDPRGRSCEIGINPISEGWRLAALEVSPSARSFVRWLASFSPSNVEVALGDTEHVGGFV